MTKTIAIIGRPNVGKSTLFNRLIEKRIAIVADEPGVTRDFIIEGYEDKGINFNLIDTAGIYESNKKKLSKVLKETSKSAIERSDILIFLLDAREGITSDDLYLSKLLRKSGKEIILVANKCETPKQDNEALELHSLGFGDPIPISAEHNRGISDLKSEIYKFGKKVEFDFKEEVNDSFVQKISILGRPNSGKSTLTNFLIQERRQLVGEESGLTRDVISLNFKWLNKDYIIIDTPGLRKKSKIDDKIEKKSTKNSLKSVENSDVSILMVDALLGFDKQDLNIANFIEDKGKPFIIAINKWDLIKNKKSKKIEIIEKINNSLSQFREVKAVFISSNTGKGLDELIMKVNEVIDVSKLSISTNNLNSFLEEVISSHTHPNINGRALRFKYITQVRNSPLTFIIFSNRPSVILDSYKRYISNNLRKEFGLEGVPIIIMYRKSENPYHNKN
ncbi:MAG: ribosome biogenesis GTPase Der [Alphaproteobacteria bacterium]